MKRKEKLRVGGKIHRKYDEPKTPYQRLLESGQISAAARKRLTAQYESLNVAKRRRRMEELQTRLFEYIEKKNGTEPSETRRRGRGIQVVGRAHAMRMGKC
jgi:hypothetical protein